MPGLLRGIEGEQPLSGALRGVPISGVDTNLCEPALRVDREVAEPHTLRRAPFVEALGAHVDAFEEIAPVKYARLLQGFARACGGELLEAPDIDVRLLEIECEPLAVRNQDRAALVIERLAEREHGLAKAVPRLLLTAIAP